MYLLKKELVRVSLLCVYHYYNFYKWIKERLL